MIDVNDMMAAENRRQEVAVRAGISVRQVKAEPSIFKELQVKWLEAFYPMEVNREFGKILAETKFPGYNWGATLHDIAKLSPEQQATEEEIQAEIERLAAESAANELQVTRTGTGAPKVDESGNVVPPIQGSTPEADATSKTDQRQRDRVREQEAKLEAAREDKPKPTQQPVVVVKEDKKDK
jgi:hypothetical protein